jgi:mannose-1-phosphate guanylyltransferase
MRRGGAAQTYHPVTRFVEKPDSDRAQAFIDEGGWYWNAGIFLFEAQGYLDRLKILAPDIYHSCKAAYDAATSDIWFFRLDKSAFAKCPDISIDYAIMERADRAAVIPVDMGWSDLGSFDALHKIQ